MKLYRNEVLTAQGDQLQGRIIIARSFSSWVLFAGAVLTVICVVSFLCTASYKKRADAQGILVLGNGAVPIISPTTGRIKAVLVSEGQVVSKGDSLFVISNERVLGRGVNNNVADKMRVELESQIDSLELEVKQIKLVERQDSVGRLAERKTLERDLKLVASQLVITESRMKLAQARLHEFNQLNKTLIVSNQFVQEQVDNVAAINIQLITFRRQRAEIERNLGRLGVEGLQSPVQAALKLSNLERELSVRRQKIVEQYAQDEWIVAAPIDGELTSITAIEGQIAATQTLGVVLPKSSNLSAQLFVDSKNVGFLTPGQKVRLRYDAFPYQKFGQYTGVVKNITRNPIEVNSLPAAFRTDSQQGKYRVSVDLADQSIKYNDQTIKLVSGMTFVADIELEQRLLIEWLIDPLHSLRRYSTGD